MPPVGKLPDTTNLPNISGCLPGRPGQVIGKIPASKVRNTQKLTDAELEIIKQHHEKILQNSQLSQENIDSGIAQQADQIAQEARIESTQQPPIDPATPPLVPPRPVDIEDLPPEERQKAMQVFAEMDELQARIHAARLRKQAQRVKKSDNDTDISEEIEVKDVLNPTAETQQTQEEVAPAVSEQSETTTEPEPEPSADDTAERPTTEKPALEAGSDISGARAYCPRCNFKLDDDVTEPTQQDKVAYLACIVGGQKRFRKEFLLFGGRITLRLRSLLPRETDMAMTQAERDMVEQRIFNLMGYARAVEAYKLAIGVEEVIFHGANGKSFKLAEPTQLALAEGEVTPLRRLREYIDNEIFVTDSMRRAVGNLWKRFNDVLMHMESNADNPDFFLKIE